MLRSNRTGANAEGTPAARTRKKNAAPLPFAATAACDPYYWLMLLHKGQVVMYSSIKYLNDAEGLAGLTTAIVKTAQNSLR
jgi:hypothetical protein